MAKRRADDSPLLLHAHDSPSKRRQRSLCADAAAAAGNTHLETGSLSSAAPEPPSPDSPARDSALPGNRCRKRPYHFPTCPEQKHEEPDVYLHCKTTHCDALTVQSHTNGIVQGHTTSTSDTRRNKRAREESETHIQDDEDDEEDCAYNSFQFWRIPLPELDLSLLDDDIGRSRTEQSSKVKQQANMMIM
ncbi:hypothetical protein JOB18_018984 [Solea senegalensis]|uniref:Putative WW-binding domain-containing protein n=1 Tax=Solea senegalensis TaxID=28829 RepID=A0AAV6QGS7_SOLSE|nr:zinc finger protein 526 [Solea senegalensis]KAG7489730.1 hypothetical protein JOB18_018984 [Solea senegalensis]